MIWVQERKREYAEGKRKLEQYRDTLTGSDDSEQTDEKQRELAIVKGMIADMDYSIEWMRIGRRPDARRGTDIRDAYSRSILMDMDLISVVEPEPEPETEISDAQKKEMIKVLMKLSDRELQCYLLHMAQGLSFAEIGKEVKLSRRSVQQYVERAKSKVGQAI